MSGHDPSLKVAASLMASRYEYLWLDPRTRSKLIQDIADALRPDASLIEEIKQRLQTEMTGVATTHYGVCADISIAIEKSRSERPTYLWAPPSERGEEP